MSSSALMPEQTQQRRLLVLHGPSLRSGGVLELLQEHFEVRAVSELEEALEVIRHERVDAVLADTADFLPLERGVVMQRASVVLETLGDGVGLTGPGGELVWANRRLRELSEAVREALGRLCRKAFEDLASASHRKEGRGKRFSMMPGGDSYYEVICSPVRDRDGILRQLAVVVSDATSQRRQQKKLNAIDRAGRELVRIDHEAVRKRDAAERLDLVRERIISCSREVLNYEHFSVLVLDKATNRLEPVVFEGLDESALGDGIFARTEGSGISGYVAATGRSYICPDVRSDPHYLGGLSDARSSLTVPLRLQDEVVGVLNVESSLPAAFDEEDRQFAEIFGTYVALAMHVLNLLIVERHQTHTQVSGSICAELTGPLNDIITSASEILDDYIGHDDLRRRMGELIDQASRARRIVQEMMHASEPGELLGGREPAQEDPVLRGRRVLVADDEPTIRETIRDVLTAYGCRVDLAVDGTEALEKLAAVRYDLVISDIRMPGASGHEVFAAAKAADSNAAVILVTAFGYDPNHSIVGAREVGLSAVLMKPFRVKQLLQECRAALSGVSG